MRASNVIVDKNGVKHPCLGCPKFLSGDLNGPSFSVENSKSCSACLVLDMQKSLDSDMREKRKVIVSMAKMTLSLSIQKPLNVAGFELLDTIREKRKEQRLIRLPEKPQSSLTKWFH